VRALPKASVLLFAVLALAGLELGCRSRAASGRSGPAASSAEQSPAAKASSAAPKASSAGAPSVVPPAGFVGATVIDAAPVGGGHAVLLVDDAQRRAIPIFVGGSEGLSIELRLAKQRYQRPLTHDLFDKALSDLDTRVHSARVVELKGGTYFAVLVLVTRERTLELDSRASDAIAMALGTGAPVFVAKKVFEQAGVALDSIADGGLPPEPDRANVAL
jgi:bifunctional DNase/RNase